MKKYIILARSIINIGGEEIYNRNKYVYLKKNYDTALVSTSSGRVYINDLKPLSDNYINELVNEPFYYSSKQRSKILNKLIKKCDLKESYEEIIIECHTVKLSLWGELLAKEIGGRSFCLLTEDRFPVLSSSTSEFFKYKLNRHELAGINKASLQLLFSNTYKVSDQQRYFLPFCCTNSIEPLKSNLSVNKSDYDIVLGTITRLEKVCVPFILDNVLEFAKQNKDKKILFLYFGGSYDQKLEKQVIQKMSVYDNLTFILTGILFPIPQVDVESVDLFINVAGAATATMRYGSPTLTFELETGKPLGIYGVTTTSCQYKKAEDKECPWKTINDALSSILIKKDLSITEIRSKLEKQIVTVDFSKHDLFIDEGCSFSKNYFDFSDYKVSKFWKFFISLIYGCFGIKFLSGLMKMYRKLFRKDVV